MEGSSGFEGAYTLLILAFEEKLYFRLGRVLRCFASDFTIVRCRFGGSVGSAAGTSLRLWRGSEEVESLAGDDWGAVDVGYDTLVGCLDSLAGEVMEINLGGGSDRIIRLQIQEEVASGTGEQSDFRF